MKRAVLTIDYHTFVMPLADAQVVLEKLATAKACQFNYSTTLAQRVVSNEKDPILSIEILPSPWASPSTHTIDNKHLLCTRDVKASPHGQKLNLEVWLYPGQALVVEDSATEANETAQEIKALV